MSALQTPDQPIDYSEEFYRSHAHRYAEVSQQLLQSVYIKSSHPKLKGDMDLLERFIELAHGRMGLDAGCGAGARDAQYSELPFRTPPPFPLNQAQRRGGGDSGGEGDF